jgi:hypothetical protein
LYATAFGKVAKTLTEGQKRELVMLRKTDPRDPVGPFLYSTPVTRVDTGDTSFLFR